MIRHLLTIFCIFKQVGSIITKARSEHSILDMRLEEGQHYEVVFRGRNLGLVSYGT